MNPTTPPDQVDTARMAALVHSLQDQPGAVLPMLHAIQQAVGFIPEQAVGLIAKAVQRTPAEIHGVISFYHQFRTTPGGAHRLQICRAEACQARGSRMLEQQAKALLGIDYHATTADQQISLEAVYCLGNCATGPNIRLNDRLVGRVDGAKLERIIEGLKGLASVAGDPAEGHARGGVMV